MGGSSSPDDSGASTTHLPCPGEEDGARGAGWAAAEAERSWMYLRMLGPAPGCCARESRMETGGEEEVGRGWGCAWRKPL